MVESYTLTEHDINHCGYYPETTKGTPRTDVQYEPFRGILKRISWTHNYNRTLHNQGGEGPLPNVQTIGQEMIDFTIEYLWANDYDTDDSTTILSMMAFVMGKNSLVSDAGRVITRGTKYLKVDNGDVEITAGMRIQGDSSSAWAIVKEFITTNSDWAGGNGAGYALLTAVNGAFTDGEDIDVFGGAKLAEADGANTEILSELDAFSIWVEEKGGLNQNHLLKGCHIKRLEMNADSNGEITLMINGLAFTYEDASPGGTATLPDGPYTDGMPNAQWTAAECTLNFVRAGTNARAEQWSYYIENEDLHFCPKDGQRYAADLVPTGLDLGGSISFRKNDTELETAWVTNPNTDKTITYSGLVGTFTAGERVVGQTSGAVGVIVTDNGSTSMTVKQVEGVFQDTETIEDQTGATATVSGTIADPSSIDFSITINKNSGNEYVKIDQFNTVPDGNWQWEHSPAEDRIRTVMYPYKVLRTGNFKIDVRS